MDAACEELEQLVGGDRVEGAGGLVGEDDVGPGDECAGGGDALGLTAGQLAGAVAQAVGQSEHPHDHVEPVLVGLGASQLERQQDVLVGGHRRQKVERLEDEADAPSTQQGERLVVEGRGVHPADDHPALTRSVKTGGAVHECRLARAGRSHDRGELAASEIDRDTVEGHDAGVRPAVDLGQILGVYGGRWRVRLRGCRHHGGPCRRDCQWAAGGSLRRQ